MGHYDLTSDHAPIRDSLSSVGCDLHIQSLQKKFVVFAIANYEHA